MPLRRRRNRPNPPRHRHNLLARALPRRKAVRLPERELPRPEPARLQALEQRLPVRALLLQAPGSPFCRR
jgi:hypothetical protein